MILLRIKETRNESCDDIDKLIDQAWEKIPLITNQGEFAAGERLVSHWDL
jgi:hypothetical protein